MGRCRLKCKLQEATSLRQGSGVVSPENLPGASGGEPEVI